MTARRSLALAALAALALSASSVHPQEAVRPATRAQMRLIFDALSTTLNLSLYDTPFAAPENREMILEALAVLSDSAAALDTHGGELNPSFDYLRGSLVRDVNEAMLRYRQEQYEGARFVLERLVDNCVACHTKLPGDGGYELGRRFVARARLEELPPQQRVRLFVATRQFELALDSYEARLKSREERAADLVAADVPGEYLKVCLRVLRGYERAAAKLRSFRKRRDLTGDLQRRMDEWIRVIEEMKDSDTRGAEMATARRLIQEARQRNAFPADQQGTAHFVIASGLLQQFLESRPQRDAETAEAYYLLGICESYTTRSRWVSETEFYLESAVRAAPASPYARVALDFLEAYVATEYTGSAGVMIPEDVIERLDELRRLVEDAR